MEQRQELRMFRNSTWSRKRLICILTGVISIHLICLSCINIDNPNLCWVSWWDVWYGVYWFGNLVAGLVFTYCRRFIERYGYKRVSAYIVFISLLSYILVAVVLDGMVSFWWGQMEDSLIKRLDESIVIIDETRTAPFKVERQSNAPFSKYEYMRYNGEDVQFTCTKEMWFADPVLPHDKFVLWKHNGKRIKPSPRIYFEYHFKEKSFNQSESNVFIDTNGKALYIYNVTTKLTIELIEDSDFGNYSCHIATVAMVKPEPYMERPKPKPPIQEPIPEKNPPGECKPNPKVSPKSCSSHAEVIRLRNKIKKYLSSAEKLETKILKQIQEFNAVFFDFFMYDPLWMTQQQQQLTDFQKIARKQLKIFQKQINEVEEIIHRQKYFDEKIKRATPPPYEWTAQFKLTKISERKLIAQAPPGGVVSLSAAYFSYADKEDIAVTYTVNHSDVLNVCSGFLNGCSKFVSLYWLFWHDGGHSFDSIPSVSSFWRLTSNALSVTGLQCACPKAFGSHRFRFYRHYYNRTTQKKSIIEVEFPHVIELVPRTPDLFDLSGNSTTTPLTDEPCWSDGNTIVLPACSHSDKIRQIITNNFFFEENIFFYGVIFWCVCVSVLCYFVLLRRFVLPCRNFILDGRWGQNKHIDHSTETLGAVCCVNTNHVNYDIIVSNAPEQEEFALEATSLFESYGQKVFVPVRDILGGETVTEAVSNAIMKSRKAVIILTPEYINSGHQNGFEFQLIWKRVRDGFIPEKDILLLVYKPCNIPSVFMHFTSLIWEENHRRADICRELKLWADKSAFREDGAISNEGCWPRVGKMARIIRFYMFAFFCAVVRVLGVFILKCKNLIL